MGVGVWYCAVMGVGVWYCAVLRYKKSSIVYDTKDKHCVTTNERQRLLTLSTARPSQKQNLAKYYEKYKSVRVIYFPIRVLVHSAGSGICANA